MKTYLFSGAYLDFFEAIASELKKEGWGEAVEGGVLAPSSSQRPRPTLLFCSLQEDSKFAKNSYEIQCEWQNIAEESSKRPLADKSTFHANRRPYMQKTETLDKFYYEQGEWIIRPSGKGFYSGKDIRIISSEDSWSEARKFYKDHANVIVSRLIIHPVLFGGKKCHVRMYLFICSEKAVAKFSPLGEILTAKSPYVAGDWANKDIHDTHSASTDSLYIYPDDFPYQDYRKIIEIQLRQIEADITGLATLRPFDTAEHCFEIFGVDVIVSQNGVLRILEINDKIGAPGMAGPRNAEFIRGLGRWAAKCINSVAGE